jgi:hypothetical protein
MFAGDFSSSEEEGSDGDDNDDHDHDDNENSDDNDSAGTYARPRGRSAPTVRFAGAGGSGGVAPGAPTIDDGGPTVPAPSDPSASPNGGGLRMGRSSASQRRLNELVVRSGLSKIREETEADVGEGDSADD